MSEQGRLTRLALWLVAIVLSYLATLLWDESKHEDTLNWDHEKRLQRLEQRAGFVPAKDKAEQ